MLKQTNRVVISGHPVFVEAAVDAVRQWKNQPTALNGEPIELDTLMYFKFMLRPARQIEREQNQSTSESVLD